MSTEKDFALEKETTDSDDGFEVLDAEPELDPAPELDPDTEQDPDDFKYLSKTEFPNAGTIIFCHLHEEYENIRQVECQYIRPEGWEEKENDVIAIFEVGWINTEEALDKMPVDLSISTGYPLGSVNLKEFSFRTEDYAEFPGAVSYFQFCYLRDGVLLGASTPFSIKGIKAVGRLPLMGDKPLFLPSGQFPGVQGVPGVPGVPDPAHDFYSAANFSAFEKSAVNIPSFKHNHDSLFQENEALHQMAETTVRVDLSALQSTVRNLTALTKRFQLQNFYDANPSGDFPANLILELKESVDELSAEMHKAAGVVPQGGMAASSQASSEDLEERFRSSAAQLKANVKGCNRTFDLCKVAIKNQTPPSSLSELERSDYVREAEWTRQESEELGKQLQKAEDELKELKEELSKKGTDQDVLKKQLETTEIELRAAKEELSGLKITNIQLNKEFELRGAARETRLTELEQENFSYKVKSQEVSALLETAKIELAETKLKNSQLNKECETREPLVKKLEIENLALKMELESVQKELSLEKMRNEALMGKKMQLEEVMDELTLKDANYKNYVSESEKEKKQTEVKMAALVEESAVFKSQIQSLLDEAKLYKSKLGDTILELTNTRGKADSLKDQCTKFVHDLNFLENENGRLKGCIAALREEIEKKGQSLDSTNDAQHDVLVQEFLKKSEELNVAKQQVENFQDELSRLNVQRTSLQKELLDARQRPACCQKPCCTFEITPDSNNHPDNVVASILEALEQSIQQNKQLEGDLDTEKKRAQSLEEKLQTAAGKHRTLYMEKITLESRLKELIGSD